jgi:hypothetical protein
VVDQNDGSYNFKLKPGSGTLELIKFGEREGSYQLSITWKGNLFKDLLSQ